MSATYGCLVEFLSTTEKIVFWTHHHADVSIVFAIYKCVSDRVRMDEANLIDKVISMDEVNLVVAAAQVRHPL